MLFCVFIVILVLWLCQRQWKMRRILILSRKLRNKYVALPIIGHGLMFLGTDEDRMKTLQELGRAAIQSKYGLTSVWLGSQYSTVTSDPVIAEKILRTSLEKTALSEVFRRLLGSGLIIASVRVWRPRRKVLAPIFSLKIVNSFVEIFAEQSMAMVKCLKSRVGTGTFSIWNTFTSYSMSSVCQTTFGVNVNVQMQPLHPFLTAFNTYFKTMAARIVQPWLHWDFLYKLLPVYQEAEKHRIIIHNFVENIIKERKMTLENENILRNLNTYTHNNVQIMTKTTFLDLLITSSDGSDGYSDLEIREDILVVMLASIDTTAVGASFTMVMLSRHLDVQEKAYQEVHEIFGDSKGPVTLEDLSRLKYIDAVVKETLRLYPPVPIIIRENDEDIQLTSGIILPAGTWTAINIWGLNRNPRYWGPDAEEFNPDRFLKGNMIPRSAYMVFSRGPRNCLGYSYAMTSIKVMVATLLRDYKVLPPCDVSSADLKKPLRVEFNITMKDVDNFKVQLEQRI